MYICVECKFQSFEWYGKCPSCQRWNTLELSLPDEKKEPKKAYIKQLSKIPPATLFKRRKTVFEEMNRVLGGGFICGETVLLSGEPGVGKSSLLSKALSKYKVLYVSGEETPDQVRQRIERMNLDCNNYYITQSTCVEALGEAIEKSAKKIEVVIIDSIQTLYSSNSRSPLGSISQIKECINQLVLIAKKCSIPIFIVGHITKSGDIAGPKTLEHTVDCVLFLEGEPSSNYRILRCYKNRFGSVQEVGVFSMTNNGLVDAEDQYELYQKNILSAPGRAAVVLYEGSRIFIYEVQSLVVPTFLAVPRRIVNGFDYNRFLLLLAVGQKYLSLPFDTLDIYFNVVGGVSIRSTEADLGILVSCISSVKNICIPSDIIFNGEIGLQGEIRCSQRIDKLVDYIKKRGFKKFLPSSSNDTIHSVFSYLNNYKKKT